ncbi:MAG TPA: antitoxin [Candidatus Woesebacteria bacterium]|nr:antitoxin [Candidatus Woesebacteria bacterium]
MKNLVLNQEEAQLVKSFEAGEWQSVVDSETEIFQLRQVARETLNKNVNINIRLSRRDLQQLKAKAARAGLPYQTMIGASLHQLANKTEQIQFV